MPSNQTLNVFLEGFPRRYLAVHSAAEIARHFALYQKLSACAAADRPDARAPRIFAHAVDGRPAALFSTISGVLGGVGHEHYQGGCVR